MKYNYEYVKQFFENNGYELLSGTYQHTHVKLDYKCPKGHLGQIRWYHFKDGGRCPICYGNAKITIQQAKDFFRENGCVLLEDSFENSRNLLRYQCSCGRIAKIRWFAFKAGQRCKGCQPQRQSGSNSPRWNPDRESVKVTKKLSTAAVRALHTTLQYFGKKKKLKTFQMLGYTGRELKRHIENHPNWNFVKDKKWSLDHVFPIKAFVDNGIFDLRVINSLDNLQPLLLSENKSKSCSYSKKDFLKWLETRFTKSSFEVECCARKS